MSQSYDLFCRWKHVQKIQSDNAGAIALGVTRATISSWKQGKNAEIQFIEKMALEIGDNPETWSALVMAERSNSEDERAAWRRIAQKLAGMTAALLLFIGSAISNPAKASTFDAISHAQIHAGKSAAYTLCEITGSPSEGGRAAPTALDLAMDHLLPAAASTVRYGD